MRHEKKRGREIPAFAESLEEGCGLSESIESLIIEKILKKKKRTGDQVGKTMGGDRETVHCSDIGSAGKNEQSSQSPMRKDCILVAGGGVSLLFPPGAAMAIFAMRFTVDIFCATGYRRIHLFAVWVTKCKFCVKG